MGATAASEATAAALDTGHSMRFDPFAMKPFIGYNAGDYIAHWLEMGDKLGAKAPKIIYVNWFRKTDDGKWLWPGFGENSRVLKWMCERVDGSVGAVETPIGYMPKPGELDLSGLDLAKSDYDELMKIDKELFRKAAPEIEEFFSTLGDRLPARLTAQLEALKKRLA